MDNTRRALEHLAELWATQPGHSEEPQTCAMHAAALLALLEELAPIGRYNVGDSHIQAAVHRAREAGFSAGGLELCNGCGQRFPRQDLEQDTQALWYCGDCRGYGHWQRG